MEFNTAIFLFIFLPVVLILYHLVLFKIKNLVLLVASLLFYAWGEPQLVLLLVASIAFNYFISLQIDKAQIKSEGSAQPKLLVTIAIICNVAVLFLFKFLAYSVELIDQLFGFGLSAPSLTLPLGISFFTFRAISYVLDVYFRVSTSEKNPMDVALYISFFPQLVSGPIQKFRDFQPELKQRNVSLDLMTDGIKRFIIGLSKKVIIANNIAPMVDYSFSIPADERGILLAWIGAVGYLIQLYFDFSGYCDMAIGLSKMFGFSCVENFNYPYISKSIGEYWRRWHISLGNWFKDYLYTPVFRGLLAKKNPLTGKGLPLLVCDILALFVVWVVCGIWHGAGIKFLVWGLSYFVFIAIERLLDERKKHLRKRLKQQKHSRMALTRKPQTRLHKAGAHLYTLLVIIFVQVIFRADDLSSAISYLECMFNPTYGLVSFGALDSLTHNWALLIIGAVLCIPIVPKINVFIDRHPDFVAAKLILQPLGYGFLFLIAVSAMIAGTYDAFIYFQF